MIVRNFNLKLTKPKVLTFDLICGSVNFVTNLFEMAARILFVEAALREERLERRRNRRRLRNELNKAPHTGSATPEQIDALLNFLDEHNDLARERLGSLEGKVQAKRLWEELCNILNSMGGCTKTVQQWQKVWADKKHLAKKAAGDFRRSASATGGGPSTAPQLSQWELKVLSIMGDGFGGRQTGARVPAFGETIEAEPLPSTSSQVSQPRSFSQPRNLDLPEEVVEYAEPNEQTSQPRQLSEPIIQPVSQESLTASRSSRLTHPRTRRSVSNTNVRSRLYKFEEERAVRETVRNTELAGIRAALLQLCGLIRENFEQRH